MKCENCLNELSNDFRYCPYCGYPIKCNIHLKSRFNSLNDKTKEELIQIILRKDKTERALNKKIQELIQEKFKAFQEKQ